MRTLQIGILLFLACAVACRARDQGLQPISDPTQRIEIPGVSVLPPQGENWFLFAVRPHEGAPGGALIRFTKKLRDAPPVRPEDHRLVYTGVFVVDMGRRFDAPAAFLEHFKEEFEGRTGEMITERQRLIGFEATLDDSLGATCVRYSRLTEVTGSARFPHAVFILATRGSYCLHPHWHQFAINVLYSQLYLKGKDPLVLDVEVEPFLKSPLFTSTRPVPVPSVTPVLRKNAEAGDPQAQLSLGHAYRRGDGVAEDYAEARKWYRKAAEQRLPEAQVYLGAMYVDGLGVTRDYSEALRWFREAAASGNAVAQLALGRMYARGYGVPQDQAEAVKWIRKAAEQGNAEAQGALGYAYDAGFGVAQDYVEAIGWYRKAASRDDPSAQFNLGNMYRDGRGVSRDYRQAVRWYRKAAEQGNPMAHNNIGTMYENGWGVRQDYAEALKWYRKAAEQGNPMAHNNIGAMYARGDGVPQDYAEALKWYRAAAEQGNALAMDNLAHMYAEGDGVAQDLTTAYMWLVLAADAGHERARRKLEGLSRRMTAAQMQEAKRRAREWQARHPRQ